MGRDATRRTTGASLSLDVRYLTRIGLLGDRMADTRLRWSSGHLARLAYHPLTGLEVRRTVREDDVERELVAKVLVERTACRFGGSRPWLVCESCGRRRLVLYLRHGYRLAVACRECLGLVYPSTREVKGYRLLRKLRRIMDRLGAESWDEDPRFLRKPKWMRWPTFERLVVEALATEEARAMAWITSFEPWLSRMEARVAKARR